MSIAYFNGDLLPLDQVCISPLDRGFLFGDAVYELIPCYQKHLFRPRQHIQRLLRSLQAIYLSSPFSETEWLQLLQQVVDNNTAPNQSIYLQVSRGVQTLRDHSFPKDTKPTVFIMSSPMNTPDLASLKEVQGIHCITAEDFRWQHCDIKTTSLLANIMLRQQATKQGAKEALLLRDNCLTEGTLSNIFAVIGETLMTPPLSQYLLGGITRELILELAQKHPIKVIQEQIPREALFRADEIWITSSSVGILPVTNLDNHTVGNGLPGSLWRTIAEDYIAYRQSLMG